jgi:hypothetical protein
MISALVIEVEIRFLGSGTLLFLTRFNISHIWSSHGRKMIPIEFEVRKSKVKCTGHQSRNMLSGLKNVILSTYRHHIIHKNYPWKEDVPF